MKERKEVKLVDVLQNRGYIRGPFGSALKRSEMKNTGIPVYEQQQAINNTRDFRYYIDEDKFKKLKRFQVKTNDLLISCSGTVGKVTIISKDDPKGIISQALLILRVDEKKIIPEYLKYFFSSPQGYNSIVSRSTGSVQVNISKREVIEQIPILLPSLIEQKKVINILQCIDKKIEINKMINRNLLEQAEILFQSWFVDYEHFGGCCPEDWTEGVLEDVVDFFNGYAFKSSELLDAPDSNNECYHVFKQGHINRGGGFNISGTKSWFPKKDSEKLSRYVLRKGDILMAMTDMKNNVAILGNTAVMEMDDTYILNQRVALLRANGTFGIEYPFVYLLTNSIDFISDLT